MSSFSFKQFTVHQDLCAMKVGTDGTLLGAWANVPQAATPRVLDVGTGTGLIALMIAQRYPQATVKGIDIDEGAVMQTRQNVSLSPFAQRIAIEHTPLQEHASEHAYDAIVCNPPFFTDSLLCPDSQRTTARHTTLLNFTDLMTHCHRLLSPDGELSVVIPFDYKDRLDTEALIAGFFNRRIVEVKTAPHKPVKRYLLSYTKRPATIERHTIVIGSDEYKRLTCDFYLKH